MMTTTKTLRTGVTALLCAFLCATSTPVTAAAGEPGKERKDEVVKEEAGQTPAVNLNTATVDELMRLPGVGQRKAEAIVARREKKKFSRPEELMDIKGIGRGIYKNCKPYLRVSGPTTLTEKVSTARKKH